MFVCRSHSHVELPSSPDLGQVTINKAKSWTSDLSLGSSPGLVQKVWGQYHEFMNCYICIICPDVFTDCQDPESSDCEEEAGSSRILEVQDKRPSMVMFNIFEESSDSTRQTRPRPSIFSALSQLAGGSHRPSIFSRLSDLSFASMSYYSNLRKLVCAALFIFTLFIVYLVVILLFYPVNKTENNVFI